MANSYFQFKQFTVFQKNSAMKVGTDGVLLGAWSGQNRRNYSRILDIGTGTGLIALMLTQRFGCAVDALEPDAGSYHDACRNVAQSPWPHLINVHHTSLQQFAEKAPRHHYDLIVCNPPFFERSQKSPYAGRNQARHNDNLPLDDLLSCSAGLLSAQGCFCVILPASIAGFTQKIHSHQLFCRLKTEVHPTPTKPPKRHLWECVATPANCQTTSLVVEIERHRYSAGFSKLVNDFYL